MNFLSYFLDMYKLRVEQKYPGKSDIWPIISGYNITTFQSDGWYFYVLHHTGKTSSVISHGEGTKDCKIFGVEFINSTNIVMVKKIILDVFGQSKKDIVLANKIKRIENDMILFDDIEISLDRDINYALRLHAKIMGLAKMKIFLSHKGEDKHLIRDFNDTLKILGFETWLDEEAILAGANPNRIFQDGVKQSCAIVFFITENFKDERFLSEEIDFAIAEKRNRGDEFSIITLRFGDAIIPEILKNYIYKEPKTNLEALREILRALPIQVGPIEYRS